MPLLLIEIRASLKESESLIMNQVPCPDPDAISRYVAGHLPWDQFNEVERHISACETCQTRLNSVVERPDEILDLIQQFFRNSLKDDEEIIERIIQEVKALTSSSS